VSSTIPPAEIDVDPETGVNFRSYSCQSPNRAVGSRISASLKPAVDSVTTTFEEVDRAVDRGSSSSSYWCQSPNRAVTSRISPSRKPPTDSLSLKDCFITSQSRRPTLKSIF
jgi:hypothetical protein